MIMFYLFQLQSIAIVASIFTTVVLALERCLAVAKPIEYHNAVQVKLLDTLLSNYDCQERLFGPWWWWYNGQRSYLLV